MRGKATQREPGHGARAVAFPPLRNFPNPRENTSNAGAIQPVKLATTASRPRARRSRSLSTHSCDKPTLTYLVSVVLYS